VEVILLIRPLTTSQEALNKDKVLYYTLQVPSPKNWKRNPGSTEFYHFDYRTGSSYLI